MVGSARFTLVMSKAMPAGAPGALVKGHRATLVLLSPVALPLAQLRERAFPRASSVLAVSVGGGAGEEGGELLAGDFGGDDVGGGELGVAVAGGVVVDAFADQLGV